MCIKQNSRLFLRRDKNHLLDEKLPEIKVTPAAHMNYDGKMNYENSGYLSLFEYIPRDVTVYGGEQMIVQAAWAAILRLGGDYVHFIFIPAEIAEILLDESNVHRLPISNRDPVLFNTRSCTPPAKCREDGTTIEFAQRSICEHLYSGSWIEGMKVITTQVSKGHNDMLNMLFVKQTVENIARFVDKSWPCDKTDGSGSDPGGDGSNSGGNCIGSTATTGSAMAV